MRSTALVANRAGGGVVAWVRGEKYPTLAVDEAHLLLAMKNRLLLHGQHPLETRDRFRYFELGFHPWKPESRDGE